MTVDPGFLAGIGHLEHEHQVHLVATLLLLHDGGQLAEELLAASPNDAWELRRVFLRSTPAWAAAERPPRATITKAQRPAPDHD